LDQLPIDLIYIITSNNLIEPAYKNWSGLFQAMSFPFLKLGSAERLPRTGGNFESSNIVYDLLCLNIIS